ncbi:MAG: hypothetical protein K2J90_03725 [Lachnospiraceae bacterium]|nr:hypothetical protein [Lachnospiraceae bacterium]
MLFKLGWIDFKRNFLIQGIIILLLVVTFLAAISMVSAIEMKLKKYMVFKEDLDCNGIYIMSDMIQNNESHTLFRDAEEIKEFLPEAEEVFTVAKLWEPYVNDMQINAWCYSPNIINRLSPELEEGRWFKEQDNNETVLKAVVSHNEDGLKTGDIVTMSTPLTDVEQKIEIIGVLQDNEPLFYHNDLAQPKGDYRDFYYTYDYESEGRIPLFILSDSQILGNMNKQEFSYLNFRLNSEKGFQRQVTAGTIVIYPDNISEFTIRENINRLNQESRIHHTAALSDIRERSQKYIFKELNDLLPIALCTFIFIVVAGISAGVISVKKHLKNYAIYYICGMQWKQCLFISLCSSLVAVLAAVGLFLFSIGWFQVLGKWRNTAMQIGIWQMLICAGIIFCYVFTTWLFPQTIVKNTSANQILKTNY